MKHHQNQNQKTVIIVVHLIDFQGNFQEVKMHESECPKREGIIIQRWSDLIFAKWSKNDILLEEIKN